MNQQLVTFYKFLYMIIVFEPPNIDALSSIGKKGDYQMF